jgi:hypothetical protein
MAMPVPLSREFAPHVWQQAQPGECVHTASLILEHLADLQKRANWREVPEHRYFLEAVRIVRDDFGVISTDVTPEFIVELYASTADLGWETAAEHMQSLTDWFTRGRGSRPRDKREPKQCPRGVHPDGPC